MLSLDQLTAIIAAPMLTEAFDLAPVGLAADQAVTVRWDALRMARFLDAATYISERPNTDINSNSHENSRLGGIAAVVGLLSNEELQKILPEQTAEAADKLANVPAIRVALQEILNSADSHNKILKEKKKELEKN
jgi:hypothetical protein